MAVVDDASLAGDLGTWFGAIGTIGSLAWLIAIFLRGERERRRERMRGQAVQVGYWPELTDAGELRFMLWNDGRLPVYDAVLVSSDLVLAVARNLVAGMLPPGATPVAVPREDLADPGQVRSMLHLKPQVLSKGLWFTDAEGMRWVRDPNGPVGPEAPRGLPGNCLEVLDVMYALSDDGERGVERGTVEDRCGGPVRLVRRRLERLRDEGLARTDDERWWRLTAAGAAAGRARSRSSGG